MGTKIIKKVSVHEIFTRDNWMDLFEDADTRFYSLFVFITLSWVNKFPCTFLFWGYLFSPFQVLSRIQREKKDNRKTRKFFFIYCLHILEWMPDTHFDRNELLRARVCLFSMTLSAVGGMCVLYFFLYSIHVLWRSCGNFRAEFLHNFIKIWIFHF